MGNTNEKVSGKRCSECGGSIVSDYTRGETYCSNCGLVISEKNIDRGPEWRAYNHEQMAKRVRIGPGTTYRVFDKGLSTLTPKIPMKKLTLISTTGSELPLAFALTEIDRMASALKLSIDIKEATSKLYHRAAKEKLIKGRSIEELVSAMCYIVCRQNQIPRTLKEIAAVSRVPIKQIRKTYLHHLKRKLNIKIPPADPVSYIPRFCAALGLNGTVSAKAIRIIKETESIGSQGLSPIGLAGAAIALVSEGERSNEQIAKVAGVDKFTIKKNSEMLKLPKR